MRRLSLCLIARDEETMLPGCLASVEGLVDEIVVVDTGSRDATPHIAREAGARVAHIPWNDDFSAPRNEALRLATGEFVLVLDADERLAPGSGPRLRAAVERGTFDCGMVRLHNASRLDASPSDVVAGRTRLGTAMLLPRVLRRAPDLRYSGIVHESVSEWVASRGMRVVPVEVDVIHFGAIPEVRAQRGKRDRNLTLLRRRCAAEPESITPFGYLALELISTGELGEAAEVVERGWAILDSQAAEISVLRLAVARAIVAVETDAPERALDAVARAELTDGAQPDLCHLRGRALVQLAFRASGVERERALAEADAAFRAALALAGRDGLRQYIAGSSSWASRNGVGEVMLALERTADALLTFQETLTECPESPEARLGEVEALLPIQPAMALARVERLLDESPDGWLLAGAAALALGAVSDARVFLAKAHARRGKAFRTPRRAHLLSTMAGELGVEG
jgi:tetratricopeptide (TPR) repeat protein